jgi:phosphatidylinositol alpha-1,6-mannosyltransferase
LRVAYVAVRAQPFDGWGRYTLGVVQAARERGIETVLLTAEREIDPSLAGIEHHVVLPRLFTGPLAGLRSLAWAPRVRPILSTCDLVHGVVEPYAPLIATSAPQRIPFVQTAHGTWAVEPLRTRPRRWFYGRTLRRVDWMLFQSAYTRDRMASVIDLPPHQVLSGGVDATAFRNRRLVSPPGWAPQGPLILSVGSLRRHKGHHVTLEAVARVARDHPTVQMAIVGSPVSGRYVEELKAQAAGLGLAERFHLVGRVDGDELAAWYARADVFVLLPIHLGGAFEGFGLCYLEAGAAGRACVATRDCGAAEAVIDGETGLLVPQNDVGAAAGAILRLLGEPELRKRYGEAGRRRAEKHSWSGLVAELESTYRRVIEERRDRIQP